MVKRRHATFIGTIGGLVLAVSALSAGAQVTLPEKFLGFKVGADFHLITYEQVVGYLDLLQSQSPRIKVFDMGPTGYGRRQKFAVVSSEENLKNLDRYKEISRRLSLGRGVSEVDARKLSEEGKPVVWIDGGLHASEVVGSNQQVQLVYDLMTSDDRKLALIRSNVITVIAWANPDGMTMVADWYKKNLGSKYEMSPMPVLYTKYAGHDDNRDSQMSNLLETQNMNRAWGEWFPEVYYNQHQTGPFPARIWISPMGEPSNPNIHPLVKRSENVIGPAGAKAMEELGLSGVISRVSYDIFFAGTTLATSQGHNVPSILTETQNYGYSTPHNYKLSEFPAIYRDLTPGQFYPNPWKGGWWRFADQVLYNYTASKGILEYAAHYGPDLLFNKWQMAHDTIERFKQEPPYGWIFSTDQHDPGTTALLLNRLILNSIEVYEADEAFSQDGLSFPKGSYIVPTSQAFGAYAKNLLERTSFPDLRKYPQLWQGQPRPQRYYDEAKQEEMLPPLTPYDNAGWTMSLLMGVDARMMGSPLKAATHQVKDVPLPAASVSGIGPVVAFSHEDSNGFKAMNRLLKAGAKLSLAASEFTLGAAKFAAGTFLVDAASVPPGTLRDVATQTGVDMKAGAVTVKANPIPKARTAVYRSWDASMDAGWATYVFDQYEFPYSELHDAEIRAGNLGDRFDVIILSDQNPEAIVNGHARGTIPEDYVGGITQVGVDHLKKFVEGGGTLICNKASLDLAIRTFALPLKNVVARQPVRDFFVPGSVLRVDFDTSQPLAYGMEEKGYAYVNGAHAFEIPAEDAAEKKGVGRVLTVIARFPDEPLLASGYIIGDEKIRGKAAVVEAQVGAGKVVLFGFNVLNRAQSYATHKLLFNGLISAKPAAGGRPSL